MSGEFLVATASAAWLGVLTAISPCPLATNVAAISYIGRRVANPYLALLTGLLYTLGRTLVYVGIAAALVSGLMLAPQVSTTLQLYMGKLMGPLLIVLGMLLLGLIQIRTSGSGVAARVGQRVADWGVWGGLPLGVVFALAFCPASAALYFAGLMPLAVQHNSVLMLPLAYGVATALPVVVFAVAIVVSARAVAAMFDRITAFERWARAITGVLFIVIGIWFTLMFIFRVPLPTW